MTKTWLKCDVCGKEYLRGNGVEVKDDLEIQEFLRVDFVGGYGSVFGDGVHVQCDICQKCLMELLGHFCRLDGKEATLLCTSKLGKDFRNSNECGVCSGRDSKCRGYVPVVHRGRSSENL